MPYAWKNDDGYHWSEILHQMDMLTAKGKKDKKHFKILNQHNASGSELEHLNLQSWTQGCKIHVSI